MRSEPNSSNHWKRPLNTLVQSGTPQPPKTTPKRTAVINGNGIKVGNKEGLTKRARGKMLTQKLSLSLINVAKAKGDTKKLKGYWNTYHCQNKLIKANDNIYSNFCKNRFCTVCSNIRKAEIINQYLPLIKTWEQPYFITLTSKSVRAPHLKKRVKDVLRAFKIITNRNKKRNQRGKGIKLIGIKSLECNFNPLKRIYNPHLHLVVANKEIADLILKEWCELWTKEFANVVAQKSKPVWNKEGALIEIVKYSTKIFTDPNMAKKGEGITNPNIYVSALDNIIEALKDHRIFERFGFNLPPKSKQLKTTRIVTQFTELKYDSSVFDWVENDTDEVLTGYLPNSQLIAILNNNIDIIVQ